MHFSDAARRGIVWALAATIGVLLLSGLTGLVIASEDVLDDVEPVAAVRSAAERVAGESFHMRVEIPLPFARQPLTQECDVDASSQRTRCLLGNVPEQRELIVTADGIYARRQRAGKPDSGQKPWVRVKDAGQLSPVPGQDINFLTELAPSLANAGQTTDLGVETIDGVKVRHFRSEVTLKNVVVPGGAEKSPVADVWLDSDGRLRRGLVTASALGIEFRVQVDISDYGKVDAIELPRAEDVQDLGPEGLSELLGG